MEAEGERERGAGGGDFVRPRAERGVSDHRELISFMLVEAVERRDDPNRMHDTTSSKHVTCTCASIRDFRRAHMVLRKMRCVMQRAPLKFSHKMNNFVD